MILISHQPHKSFLIFLRYFIVPVDQHSDTTCTFTRLKLVHQYQYFEKLLRKNFRLHLPSASS